MLLKNEKRVKRYIPNPTKCFMSTQLDNNSSLPFDTSHFETRLPQMYRVILNHFRKAAQTYVSFNIAFFSLLAVELFLFFTVIPYTGRPILFASSLALFFLSCFSYILLLFYFQAKKPEQVNECKENFIQSCRQHISLPSGEAQHHLSIAEALTKLSLYLQDFECSFYTVPFILSPIKKWIQSFGAHCYWEDVFKMRETLLKSAVEEHLSQIRITPTDLEVHASLANTYVFLSKLYRSLFATEKKKYLSFSEKNFRHFTELAIEEFRILNDYAPQDPWVHEQLSIGYKDLEMPSQELKEIEILLKLKPQDKEILFRLGSLCFEQGQNARGLQIYEELKQSNYKKASDLIALYGVSTKN
jgi:hypothetical protein